MRSVQRRDHSGGARRAGGGAVAEVHQAVRDDHGRNVRGAARGRGREAADRRERGEGVG